MIKRHLTQSQENELHQALLNEKSELEKLIDHNDNFGLSSSLGESIQELSTYDNHPGDIGTEVFERGKDLALNERMERELTQVDAALALMDSNEYGLCKQCGEPIPFERLQAIPFTTYCLEHTPDQIVSDDRPIEEAFLAPGFGRTSLDENPEQNQFDGEDAWQIVSGWGTSNSPAMAESPEVLDYDSVTEESDENDGYVEDMESFLATDLYGNDVFLVRNKAYYSYLDRKDGDPLLEPDLQDDYS